MGINGYIHGLIFTTLMLVIVHLALWTAITHDHHASFIRACAIDNGIVDNYVCIVDGKAAFFE